MDYDVLGTGGARARRRAAAALVGLVVAATVLLGVRNEGARRLEETRAQVAARFGSADPSFFQPPSVAEADNAATALLRAALAIRLTTDEQRLLLATPSDWSEREGEARALLVAHAADLARLRSAAGRSRASFELDYSAGADTDLPPFLALGRAAQLLQLHAHLAARDGDAALAAGSIAALGRLADALWNEPTLVTSLLAASYEMRQLEAARELVVGGTADAAALAAVRDAILRRDPAHDLRRAVGGESASLLDLLGGPERRRRMGAFWRLVDPVAGDWLVAESLRPHLALATAAGLPYPQLADRVDRAREEALLAGPYEDLVADLARFARRVKTIAAQRQLARAALGVRLAAIEEGEYPAAAAEVASLPAEDPLGGGPVGYERTAAGSARLTLPAAGEVLAAIPSPARDRARSDLLVWELPPA